MNIRASLTSVATLIILLTPLLACTPSIGDATAGEDTGATDPSDPTSTPTGGAEGGEWSPCSASNPCPDGQFCFNGLCALGCTSNGDCAADQYCDTEGDMLCHNKAVATCPEVACPEGQQCVSGFCSGGSSSDSCAPMPNGEDGCAKDALCVSESDEAPGQCYTFPACAEDDTCPKGTIGAVCNVALIPSKDRICLPGACLDAAEHCPSGQYCVKFSGDLGACSEGDFGAPCNGPGECKSGACDMPFPGQPGFCN